MADTYITRTRHAIRESKVFRLSCLDMAERVGFGPTSISCSGNDARRLKELLSQLAAGFGLSLKASFRILVNRSCLSGTHRA